MERIEEVGFRLGVAPMCDALGIARSSFYRHQRPTRERGQRCSSRALLTEQLANVLEVLHEERFVDQSPAVTSRLLDEGKYLCSERTMYRILSENKEVRERREQLRHPRYEKPELLATGPNEL